jgi:hypothetical protein
MFRRPSSLLPAAPLPLVVQKRKPPTASDAITPTVASMI